MPRHEYPSNQEIIPTDPALLRSELMRCAARLTESGHRLNPQNLEGITQEDALAHMRETVTRINAVTAAIAAQALKSSAETLPELINADLESAS